MILYVLASVMTLPAYAGVDTKMSRAILEATRHDTSMSDKEKLYTHRCDLMAKHVGFPDTPTGKAIK